MFNRNPKHWKMQHIQPDINEHLKNNNTDHCPLDSINNTTSTIMSRPSNWTTWRSTHHPTTVEPATSGGVPDDANSTMTNAATTSFNIHCDINRKSVKRTYDGCITGQLESGINGQTKCNVDESIGHALDDIIHPQIQIESSGSKSNLRNVNNGKFTVPPGMTRPTNVTYNDCMTVQLESGINGRNKYNVDESKQKKNREKSNRSYRKKFYEDQVKYIVDKYNKENQDARYVPLEKMVWIGDMKTGSFETVVPLTPMGEVHIMQRRGLPRKTVQGAIVKSSCNKKIIVHEESRFQMSQACWAKWGDDAQSEYCRATKLTGYICFSGRQIGCQNSRYAYMLFDDDNKSKSKKKNENYKWKCPNQTQDDKRSRAKNARRISLPEKGEKKGKNEKDHSIIKEKEYSNRGHIPKEHTKRYWEIITKLAKEQNTTDEKDIATLIVKADRNWKRDEIMRKDSKDRTSSLLCFQPPPKTNLIELSMIFDTLRGELPCRIPIVEKAFGLKKYLKDNNIFIIRIVSMTQIQFNDRIKNDNTIQEKRKKWCKIEGCKKFAHNAFGKDCVCYKHADKEKKQCKQCGLRVGRNKGDLCNHCFAKTKKKDDSNGSTDKICKNCMARPARIAGGLCKTCRIR